MQRSTKRKAASNSISLGSSRAVKKAKHEHDDESPRDKSADQAAKTTTELGLRFVEHIKKSVDKHNRPIATAFLSLPDRHEVPNYYDVIALPISLETIQKKLEGHGYASLSELESDVKRMERNAKEYNETASAVYQDAERIRKATLNWMHKMNPDHKKPGYSVAPTPIPEPEKRLTLSLKNSATKRSASAELKKKSEARSEVNGTSSKTEREKVPKKLPQQNEETDDDKKFAGKDFQQAQEQLIAECLEYIEDGSNIQIFTPFADLPSRSLTDYYAIIKNPTSLKGVRRRIHGKHGRESPTGITDFKSWDALEHEVQKIWENARLYNEDESEMFLLAGQLETFFKTRLALAKKHVEEPPQPTLKLNMKTKPTSLKLRLGAGSPKASPGRTASPVVKTPQEENEAQPQSKQISASVVGEVGSSNKSVTPGAGKSAVVSTGLPTVNGMNGNLASTDTQKTVASPTATTSQSNGVSSHSQCSLDGSRPPTAVGPIQPHVPYYTPPTGLQSKWRTNGRNSSNALIERLSIVGRSSQVSLKPKVLSVLPNDQLSQQSVTITMPPSHSLLEVEPHLSSALAVASSPAGRPYKIFVAQNGRLLAPARRAAVDAGLKAEIPRLLYEIRLASGMTRLEIEVVADSEAPGEEGYAGRHWELHQLRHNPQCIQFNVMGRKGWYHVSS